MARILDLYEASPADGRVICVDEFGLLNLQPRPGRGWFGKGQPTRRRAAYLRTAGVRQLFAALDLAPGQLSSGSVTANAGGSPSTSVANCAVASASAYSGATRSPGRRSAPRRSGRLTVDRARRGALADLAHDGRSYRFPPPEDGLARAAIATPRRRAERSCCHTARPAGRTRPRCRIVLSRGRSPWPSRPRTVPLPPPSADRTRRSPTPRLPRQW